MKDMVKSNLGEIYYNPAECVRCVDRYQAYLFIKHNAYPVDVYVDMAKENLVFVFKKDDTRELYQAYRRYELT